ncbi:MAG: nickel pincer cofactor biosynthesis protein LarC, partial [Candidatus Edwardsbacteria bacterium]|nr:nickel pincer cofactor biosynthesis protein LarC [Candidatus Edwardsbacteria bacterium]
MRTVFFDCPTGAAGNMLLAALIDAGADARRIERQLGKLPLKGWSLGLRTIRKQGVAALHLEVKQGPQPERHLPDIFGIIDRAKLSDKVTGSAYLIFGALAKAEAQVHHAPIGHVHFHEVGAVDAIVDIVGTCLALEDLNVEEVRCSPLNVGHGTVRCAHGLLPVPAPATALLLRKATIYQNEIAGELVTPTGAAILTTLARGFGPMPEMTVTSVGHGAGSRELGVPNMVRAFIGGTSSPAPATKQLVLLETNIDDLNPQVYQHLMELLFKAGTLDAWMTPVYMKKNRPGIVLSVLVPSAIEQRVADLIFTETTSLGIRR